MLLKILILVAYASTSLADRLPVPTMERITQQCYMNGGLSSDLTDAEFASKMECIFACIMKKLETMSSEGAYQAEKIIESIPKELPNYDVVISALRTCAKKTGETHCKTAILVRDCLSKNLPCKDFWACNKGSEAYLYWNPLFNPL